MYADEVEVYEREETLIPEMHGEKPEQVIVPIQKGKQSRARKKAVPVQDTKPQEQTRYTLAK